MLGELDDLLCSGLGVPEVCYASGYGSTEGLSWKDALGVEAAGTG